MTPVSANKNIQDSTGSPQDGGPVFLLVGRLGRPHGLHGHLLFQVLTDFPERLEPSVEIFVGKDKAPLRITSFRPHGNKFLIRLAGIESRDLAVTYRNTEVFVRTADVPDLPEGEYYQHQLLDLTVQVENGETLGRIAEILTTGANDVFVVRAPGKKEILLPNIPDVVVAVELAAGRIVVALPDGLIP